jgi:hypothetical protein
MFHAGAGGMTDVGTVHFKEPLCTKLNDLSDQRPDRRSYSNYEWIREKDCENGLAFLPSTQRLENVGPGAAAHMSLHLD